MIRRFLSKFRNTATGGAIVIASFSVLSRLLGLLRDRFLAASFGAGDTLDCYYAAFKLPDLVFNTFIVGALSVSFIPVFLKYWKKDRVEAWKVAGSAFNAAVLFLSIFAAVIFVFAPQIVPTLIVPGFSPEKQALTIRLTRIMMAGMVFLGASSVASSVLNSFKKFLAFSLAPVMYNLGIIFGISVLVPQAGTAGLAWGVVLGTALHFSVQIPGLLKLGFRWKPAMDLRHPGVRKIGRLMLPRTLGLAVNQVNQLVVVIIASTLASGSLAVFNLANNLQHFPIGVFGISLAIASFPYLSESATEKDFGRFVARFSLTFRRILFLIIPTSVLMILLRAQIVRLVLGSGNFGWADTVLTLRALGFFSFSLFAHATIPLMARCFYALQDTRTPVAVSVFSLAINIGLGIVLGKAMGAPGLALAFSIAIIINAALLFVLLKVRLGKLDDKKIVISMVKITFISLAMAAIVQFAKDTIGNMVDMQSFAGVLAQFSVSVIIGIVAYLALAVFLKCEEIEIVRKGLFRLANKK